MKNARSFSTTSLNSCVLIIKELFKHWKMGHTSLTVRKWPKVVKYVVKNMYIDPFYKWLIANEVAELETGVSVEPN